MTGVQTCALPIYGMGEFHCQVHGIIIPLIGDVEIRAAYRSIGSRRLDFAARGMRTSGGISLDCFATLLVREVAPSGQIPAPL